MDSKTKSSFYDQFLPFLHWLPELRKGSILRADMVAGLTVALVLIPQSMAYAQLAGLPPYYGLYAAFLPPIVASIWGSSRQLATGPVAVVSLLTAAALEPLATAGSEAFVAYAVLLALFVGLFQLALGLLKLGVLVNFLSHPVVQGFTNAAAIIIASSQLSKIFGVSIDKSPRHYETVWNTLLTAASETHWPTLAIAVLAFTIMIVLRRINPRLPDILIAVAVTTVISWYIGFEKKQIVTAEKFAVNATIQALFRDYQEGRRQLRETEAELASAERTLEGLRDRHGDKDRRTRAAQTRVDRLRERLEDLATYTGTRMKEITKMNFVHEKGDEAGRFHFEAEAPDHVLADKRIWHITRIDDEGRFELHGGGRVVGKIPEGLPSFSLPRIDLGVISQLFFSAVAIALIGFMEAISIAKAMAARTRQRLDANQELIGQGLGNIVGSLFQSYPTSGSFSRSAVNIGAGAVTGFSSVVTGLVVVIMLLWLTPLLYHLPEATLAAVIMMAVIGLVNVRVFTHTWKVNRDDGVVAIATFLLTLIFAPHLDLAILIGITLSLGIFLYRSMKPRVVVLSRHPDGTLRDASTYGLETCQNITIIRFDGPLYFANMNYFEDTIIDWHARNPDLKHLIVDAVAISSIDASGEEMLAQLVERMEKAGVQVYFTRLRKQVMDVLRAAGFVERVGSERFFRRPEMALDHVWKELGDDHATDCPLNIVCRIGDQPQEA